MNSPKTNIITFGCRLNACESDRIKEIAEESGVVDFTVINTCAVTAEAERKLRRTIRRLHNENPKVKIILTGCASELNPADYMKMDGIVGIISNKNKLLKSEYLKYAFGRPTKSTERPKKVRGFLQIQNGCNHGCTYCIVRRIRGRNVSFPEEDILSGAKALLQKGYREIVLTGVNVSSYGQDLNPRKNLASLVGYLLKNLPELNRLRLSSLDPADIDDDLIEIIKSEERLLPHIHESVQSGNDTILQRMMRRHTRSRVIETNEKILALRPDAVFGADIIAGFPTETDEMFADTRRLLTEAKLSLLHVFPFSARPGTPAARMPQVENKIIRSRAAELKKAAREILFRKLSDQIGKDLTVLAETPVSAKTDSFLPVRSSEAMIVGNEYLFRCESVDKNVLVGRPVKEK
ncbi:MAG: tRNA (N(6)-L-threonylcarbamoyladenosine(37)-C(2))-methylthiotransferase MtaB [Holosporaceae bacterium]|jgi:threonylcarbamoyladenosine tRNA methylthiotransferase MtaB|nr:tRNA (N(6)-L-threonylcarbamoyladenosine(37)-C(2))-methylthiotransferase MtaB [Holosporaceae bacterium]